MAAWRRARSRLGTRAEIASGVWSWRRLSAKARGGRISGRCNRRPTQPDGSHRDREPVSLCGHGHGCIHHGLRTTRGSPSVGFEAEKCPLEPVFVSRRGTYAGHRSRELRGRQNPQPGDIDQLLHLPTGLDSPRRRHVTSAGLRLGHSRRDHRGNALVDLRGRLIRPARPEGRVGRAGGSSADGSRSARSRSLEASKPRRSRAEDQPERFNDPPARFLALAGRVLLS